MEQYWQLISLVVTLLGSLWLFSIWLNKQFSSIKDRIDMKVDQLETTFTEKLIYHERHDDKRFSDINNSLWELRLRQAAVLGYAQDKKDKEVK